MAQPESTAGVQENHEEAINRAINGDEFEAWIDGEQYSAASGETFETIDPVVDEPITTLPRCGKSEIDVAVDAAQEALEGEWGETSVAERIDLLQEWAEVLRENRDRLALLESLDIGKPLEYAGLEIDGAIGFIEYYAQIARAQEGEQIPVSEDSLVYTRKEPYGVCGQITPWNFPLYIFAWKVGAALATGNTVVQKPAELSPLSAVYATQLSDGILPDGVLNCVPGFGTEAGAPLTEHDEVDKISFTGEDVTGEQVMQAAAKNITPVTLELGGKSPMIVFPDADLKKAAEATATGIVYNTGQCCDAASRVLVHEDIKDAFVEQFLEEIDAWELGDPLNEGTMVGPLAHEEQYEKVQKYIEIGTDEGAELIAGGGHPDGDEFRDGFFVEPTVFDGVDNDMRIAQEEIFGPVECIITYSTYEEAIELANDIEFGLCGYVATEDTSLAHRAAADIEAGLIGVNKYPGDDYGVPFGGFKRSGIGRECAQATLDHYTTVKTVNVDLDEPSL